jgi:hypothetical protein
MGVLPQNAFAQQLSSGDFGTISQLDPIKAAVYAKLADAVQGTTQFRAGQTAQSLSNAAVDANKIAAVHQDIARQLEPLLRGRRIGNSMESAYDALHKQSMRKDLGYASDAKYAGIVRNAASDALRKVLAQYK